MFLAIEKSVGAVIFRRSEKGIEFLLMDHGQGYWNVPKGHMEEGETEMETLMREVAEETGLKELNIIPGFRQAIHYFYRAKDAEKTKRIKEGKGLNIFKTVVNYLAESGNEQIILSDEHIGFQWLSFKDAMAKISFNGERKIFTKAHKFLEKL